MADGVTCTESKTEQLDGLLASSPWVGAEMGLSEANITPTAATVAADLVPDEPTVAGYARQVLTGWSAPTLDGSNRAVSDADPVTFDNTDAVDTGTIYCWFFMDSGGTLLLQAGRFAVPFVIVDTNGTYTTTPFARLSGE